MLKREMLANPLFPLLLKNQFITEYLENKRKREREKKTVNYSLILRRSTAVDILVFIIFSFKTPNGSITKFKNNSNKSQRKISVNFSERKYNMSACLKGILENEEQEKWEKIFVRRMTEEFISLEHEEFIYTEKKNVWS